MAGKKLPEKWQRLAREFYELEHAIDQTATELEKFKAGWYKMLSECSMPEPPQSQPDTLPAEVENLKKRMSDQIYALQEEALDAIGMVQPDPLNLRREDAHKKVFAEAGHFRRNMQKHFESLASLWPKTGQVPVTAEKLAEFIGEWQERRKETVWGYSDLAYAILQDFPSLGSGTVSREAWYRLAVYGKDRDIVKAWLKDIGQEVEE